MPINATTHAPGPEGELIDVTISTDEILQSYKIAPGGVDPVLGNQPAVSLHRLADGHWLRMSAYPGKPADAYVLGNGTSGAMSAILHFVLSVYKRFLRIDEIPIEFRGIVTAMLSTTVVI